MIPTLEKISTESAGKQLDSWVVCHVLKWHTEADAEPRWIENWSTDDRLAMRLVVELCAKRFMLSRRSDGSWDACFDSMPAVANETIALAVCRAALFWKLYAGGVKPS